GRAIVPGHRGVAVCRTLHCVDSLFGQIRFVEADRLRKRSGGEKSETNGGRSRNAGPGTPSRKCRTKDESSFSVGISSSYTVVNRLYSGIFVWVRGTGCISVNWPGPWR